MLVEKAQLKNTSLNYLDHILILWFHLLHDGKPGSPQTCEQQEPRGGGRGDLLPGLTLPGV